MPEKTILEGLGTLHLATNVTNIKFLILSLKYTLLTLLEIMTKFGKDLS